MLYNYLSMSGGRDLKAGGLINQTEARQYLVELLPKAGAILNFYFRSVNLKLKSKSQVDIVSEADEAVDKFLHANLNKAFPKVIVLTEEATAPAPYSKLKKLDDLFCADPLDGTFNFSRGRANHAISAGLIRRGDVVVSVVYIPQAKELFWAQQDQEGAFFQDPEGNLKQIHVSEISDPKQASIGIDWVADYPDLSYSLRTFKYFSKLIRSPRRQFLSMGSAVADLSHLAAGQLEVYLNCGLNPWDNIPYLLVEKAGGRVTTPTGKPFNAFERNIFASNGILHDYYLELFKGV